MMIYVFIYLWAGLATFYTLQSGEEIDESLRRPSVACLIIALFWPALPPLMLVEYIVNFWERFK